MHVYVSTLYTHTHTYTYMRLTYIHACMHACMHAYTYTRTYIHMCVGMHIYIYTHECTYVCIYKKLFMYVKIIGVCVRMCIYIYIYICTTHLLQAAIFRPRWQSGTRKVGLSDTAWDTLPSALVVPRSLLKAATASTRQAQPCQRHLWGFPHRKHEDVQPCPSELPCPLLSTGPTARTRRAPARTSSSSAHGHPKLRWPQSSCPDLVSPR